MVDEIRTELADEIRNTWSSSVKTPWSYDWNTSIVFNYLVEPGFAHFTTCTPGHAINRPLGFRDSLSDERSRIWNLLSVVRVRLYGSTGRVSDNLRSAGAIDLPIRIEGCGWIACSWVVQADSGSLFFLT
jgi:hypothetical protein